MLCRARVGERTYAAGTTHYREINERIDADLMDALANQKSLAICVERIDGNDALLQTLPHELSGAIETGSTETPEHIAGDLASLIALKHREIESYTSLIEIAEAAFLLRQSPSVRSSYGNRPPWRTGSRRGFLQP